MKYPLHHNSVWKVLSTAHFIDAVTDQDDESWPSRFYEVGSFKTLACCAGAMFGMTPIFCHTILHPLTWSLAQLDTYNIFLKQFKAVAWLCDKVPYSHTDFQGLTLAWTLFLSSSNAHAWYLKKKRNTKRNNCGQHHQPDQLLLWAHNAWHCKEVRMGSQIMP